MTVERINATWEVDLGLSSEVPGGRLVRIDGDIMVRASDYDALEARAAELEKDAERYRFLKSASVYWMYVTMQPSAGTLFEGHDVGKRLDREIDAWRAAHSAPETGADACCDNEKRNMNGGCDNCGDPCL
jgi:hypothetical protein